MTFGSTTRKIILIWKPKIHPNDKNAHISRFSSSSIILESISLTVSQSVTETIGPGGSVSEIDFEFEIGRVGTKNSHHRFPRLGPYVFVINK